VSQEHGRLSNRLNSRHLCQQGAELEAPKPALLREVPSPTQYSTQNRQSSTASQRHNTREFSMITSSTQRWHQDLTFDSLSDSPSYSPGDYRSELSSDQTSELSGELNSDLAVEVRTHLPVEVPIESRTKVRSDLSIDWTSDMPVEWLNEMPTEWWIELPIELPSKVPSELPSPESSAWSGFELGRERMGECVADAYWNRC